MSLSELAQERQGWIAHHWDLFKDVRGIRPRWVKYENLSTQEIKDMIDSLEREYEEQERVLAEQMKHARERVARMKLANAYKPNLVFADLRKMMEGKA